MKEKRLVGMAGPVASEHVDGMLSDGGRRIITASRFDRGQRLIVQGMFPGTEVAVVIVERVGMIETAREHLAVHLPLAGMIRAVAQRTEQLRQQPRPSRPFSVRTAAQPRQRIAPDLLRVVAGENARPRRPAASRIVELREAQTTAGQPVQIRGLYLASITTGIRKSHVIGHNHQDVGPVLCRREDQGVQEEGTDDGRHGPVLQ